jgi:hypothetical protein
MLENQEDTNMLNMVKMIVERHGCKLVDVDFEKHLINIEGPEENQANCARALSEYFG